MKLPRVNLFQTLLIVGLAGVAIGEAKPLPGHFQRVENHPPENVRLLVPTAVNASGEMVGNGWLKLDKPYSDSTGTFYEVGVSYFLAHGKVTIVPTPGGAGGPPNLFALNNRHQGLMVRTYSDYSRCFLCDLDHGTAVQFGVMASVNEGGKIRTVRLAYLRGLNDAGEVYGVYGGPLGVCVVAGTPVTISADDRGPLPATPAPFRTVAVLGPGNYFVTGINQDGDITGVVDQHIGFVWRHGKMTKFSFPGAVFTTPTAINSAGIISGNIQPYNWVDENGQVENFIRVGGGMKPQQGFVYDGTNFRLVRLPQSGGTVVHVAAITDASEVIGYVPGGEETSLFDAFVVKIDDLPIAHMTPSAAENTAAAIAHRLVTPASDSGPSDPFDRAYEILRSRGWPAAALTLRALQLLEAEGPMDKPEMEKPFTLTDVHAIDPSPEMTSKNIGYMGKMARLRTEIFWAVQLSEAQRTPEGAAAVVEATAALVGDANLPLLQAAGDLTDDLPPFERDKPETKARQAAQGKLMELIRQTLRAHPADGWPDLSPATLRRWQPEESGPVRLQELAETLHLLHDHVGRNAAASFFAGEIIHLGLEGTKYDVHTHLFSVRSTAMDDTDLLAGLQFLSELIEMRTEGKADAAEFALRAWSNAPAPGPCPGLNHLTASGRYREDLGQDIFVYPIRQHLLDAIQTARSNRIRHLGSAGKK